MRQPTERYTEIARLFRECARAEGTELAVDPATVEELQSAQDALGCQFPESYAWFQLEFGQIANSPLLNIFSVRPDPPALNIVGVNLEERHDAHPALPASLVAFVNSGGGDLCCFDTSALEDGECPVVWWDHEADEDQVPELAAASFVDWLEHEIRERAAEEKGTLLDGLGHVHASWLREWLKNK
jgi:SMI1-KNR4 cell-wall